MSTELIASLHLMHEPSSTRLINEALNLSLGLALNLALTLHEVSSEALMLYYIVILSKGIGESNADVPIRDTKKFGVFQRGHSNPKPNSYKVTFQELFRSFG